MSETVTGATGEWEIIIGLEIHAQVISNAKLFSGASTEFGADPNTQVSPVDAGMPGMLPVPNEYVIEQAVRTGLGLNAEIMESSVFERKQYFYPDLPQGYQISQYEHPIVGTGRIEIDLPDGSSKNIGITRLHLEQDAGKSMHDQHPTKSYVDLNRSGCALMEIVSEPDLRGGDEAAAYISKLRMILRYLGTCDGNMEEGSLRADVNLSVRRTDSQDFGTRCEIKNVNSIRAVQQAITHEAERQVELLEDGQRIIQETRLWDPDKGETRSMRNKEEAHDYRYFPDPDLLPLHVGAEWVRGIKETLPELPDQKKNRFMQDYGLSAYDAGVLIAERARAEYFEAVAEGRDAKQAANWVLNELLGLLNKDDRRIKDSPITAQHLGQLIDRIGDGTISTKIAKDVFETMYETSKEPDAIIEEQGLKQVTDTSEIEPIVDEVLDENPENVEAYKGGKDKLLGFFVGQVMKKTGGKANPQMVNDLLKSKLDG
jgi:aspartyl-tRNA(Asn)/glutamyl-tRNA(Gln) amidotransferase subunit B